MHTMFLTLQNPRNYVKGIWLSHVHIVSQIIPNILVSNVLLQCSTICYLSVKFMDYLMDDNI